MIVLLLVLALAVASPAVAVAATVPSMGDILKTPAAPVPRPEPTALQANWWRYFDTAGKALEQHIQEINHRLETLLTELPKETADTARPLIENIENNLDTLAQARAQPSPTPPPPLVYEESYTISQLMDIVGRLNQEQADLQSERNEAAASEKAIVIANQGVDTRLAAYLSLAPTDPQRLLRGLEIMEDRSAVAVAEEKLRVRKAALSAHETAVEQLANEQAVAVTRLAAQKADLDQLDSKIAQAQAILQQAQERITKEQTTALSLAADRTQTLKLPYQQQRVVNAKVIQAVASVRLIRLQAERQLTALLLDTPFLDTRALREQLENWETQLADMRKEIVDWTRDSQQERNHAAEGMATGSSTSGGAIPLFGMLYGDRLALAQQTLATLQTLEDAITQIETLLQVVDKTLTHQVGGLRDWLERSQLMVQHLWEIALSRASRSMFKIGDTPVTALGLMRVALILVIAWLISHWFRRVLVRLATGHGGVTQSALFTIGRLFHYSIITLGFIIGLSSIGIDFTNFAVVAGAIGIGIGFGLQSIVNNFVSGLILLFERTLKVGDFIELESGLAGEVRAINVRSTLINTNDNVDVVVPNSKFINGDVVNWTLLEAYCRIHVGFKVPYGTDVELVNQAVLEASDNVPYTLKQRKPSVWLVDFGDSSFNFELVVWITPEAVKRPGAVHAAYRWEIAIALRRHGIEIPVPQRELRLRSGFKDFLQSDPDMPPDRHPG